MPFVLQFCAAHTDIQLNVDFEDRHTDLLSENYDLANRLTDQPDDRLVAQSIGSTHHGLNASPTYLDAHGSPASIDALSVHALLHHGAKRRARWVFTLGSQQRVVTFKPTLSSNSGDFLLGATRAGQGIARLPDFLVKASVEAGNLVPVLPEAETAELGIYLIRVVEKRMNPRMRQFAEHMRHACVDGFSACAKGHAVD